MLLLGWVIASALLGAAAVTFIVSFWEEIKVWLNNTAANAVEKVLGYGAKKRMHRAIATIDRVVNVIRNRTVVYTKKEKLSTMYDKVTMEADVQPYEIDSKVLDKISKEKHIVQEFNYKQ